MQNYNLNNLVTNYFHYHNHVSGSFTRQRDQIFLELKTEYCRRFSKRFRMLPRRDRPDLEQEIALSLWIRLNKPFKHENRAATLKSYINGRVTRWCDNRNMQMLKPELRDYKNRDGGVIPAIEVIEMWRTEKYLKKDLAQYFNCDAFIISYILKLACEDLSFRKNSKKHKN